MCDTESPSWYVCRKEGPSQNEIGTGSFSCNLSVVQKELSRIRISESHARPFLFLEYGIEGPLVVREYVVNKAVSGSCKVNRASVGH